MSNLTIIFFRWVGSTTNLYNITHLILTIYCNFQQDIQVLEGLLVGMLYGTNRLPAATFSVLTADLEDGLSYFEAQGGFLGNVT